MSLLEVVTDKRLTSAEAKLIYLWVQNQKEPTTHRNLPRLFWESDYRDTLIQLINTGVIKGSLETGLITSKTATSGLLLSLGQQTLRLLRWQLFAKTWPDVPTKYPSHLYPKVRRLISLHGFDAVVATQQNYLTKLCVGETIDTQQWYAQAFRSFKKLPV